MVRFQITVFFPDKPGQPFRYFLNEYETTDTGRIRFVDEKTGKSKEFPLQWCAIEEVKQ